MFTRRLLVGAGAASALIGGPAAAAPWLTSRGPGPDSGPNSGPASFASLVQQLKHDIGACVMDAQNSGRPIRRVTVRVGAARSRAHVTILDIYPATVERNGRREAEIVVSTRTGGRPAGRRPLRLAAAPWPSPDFEGTPIRDALKALGPEGGRGPVRMAFAVAGGGRKASMRVFAAGPAGDRANTLAVEFA